MSQTPFGVSNSPCPAGVELAKKAKRPSRKKGAKKYNGPGLAFWLGFLLIANVTAGLAFSPIISLSKVRVSGTLPTERQPIESALQKWAGKPLTRLNAAQIESDVLTLPEVASAHFEYNPFGRGILKVNLRRPVGYDPDADVVLTDDGSLVRWPTPIKERLTRILLPPSVFHVGAALQLGADLKDLVQAVAVVKKELPETPWLLELNQPGYLCLNRLGAGKVILGDSSHLTEKLTVLKEKLALRPELATSPAEINLVDPSSPRIKLPVTFNESARQPLRTERKLGHPGHADVRGAGLHAH